MIGSMGIRPWVQEHPWVWSFLAALLAWIITFSIAGRGAFSTLTTAAVIAVFLVVVGIGQMFVITAGNGNIDLSIPYVMALAAYLSAGVMNGSDDRLWLGLAVGFGAGLVVALANVVLIRGLLIPPIIATLATGFLVESVTLVRSSGFSALPSPALMSFTTKTVAGIPVMVIVFVLVALLAAVVLQDTRYGRSVQAIGQKFRAARLAGVRVGWAIAASYIISGLLAGLAGVLIGAYSGGASLDISQPYLLGSIAVVVLGGSQIAGGKSNVPGIWGAALFLTLLVTMLNVAKLSAGWQDVIEGLMIISVLALASGQGRQ